MWYVVHVTPVTKIRRRRDGVTQKFNKQQGKCFTFYKELCLQEWKSLLVYQNIDQERCSTLIVY